MSVKKEFRCLAHGNFESSDETPACPYGCDTVERIFLTPPAFRSNRTRGIDSTLESLAKRHGLTDMNNSGGQAVRRRSPKQNQQQAEFNAFLRERYGDGWGNIPQGGTMNVQTKEVTGNGPGVGGALAQYHGRPDNALNEVRDAGLLVQKPVLVRQDHENLKVENARPPV